VPLKYLWTLEKGIHPGVLFEVEYSGEYAGINETTPCMGVVIDCLAGPPCWRSQWTCQKPTYTITDENGTHIHNETLHWDGEENVEVLKRDLNASTAIVTIIPTTTWTDFSRAVVKTVIPTVTWTDFFRPVVKTITPTITSTDIFRPVVTTITPTITETAPAGTQTVLPTVTVTTTRYRDLWPPSWPPILPHPHIPFPLGGKALEE
jgi:hypothetical protein